MTVIRKYFVFKETDTNEKGTMQYLFYNKETVETCTCTKTPQVPIWPVLGKKTQTEYWAEAWLQN